MDQETLQTALLAVIAVEGAVIAVKTTKGGNTTNQTRPDEKKQPGSSSSTTIDPQNLS